MTFRKPIVVSLTAVALCAIPAIAGAHAGNNDPNVVHACVGNVSKIVRNVGVTGSCLSAPAAVAETPVHWGIQGPVGPAGPAGTPGLNGTNGTNGMDGRDGAGATRADGPCFDNTNRYVDCGNGTVTDTLTGLIWLKEWNCLPNTTWAPANQAAAALKSGDCSLTDHSLPGDWRLPTRDEWIATMARATRVLGCLVGQFGPPQLTNDAGTTCYGTGAGSSFTDVSQTSGVLHFWSNSTDETLMNAAWMVNLAGFSFVSFEKELNIIRVWPVRGGSR